MRVPPRLSGASRHSSTVRGTCSEPGTTPVCSRSASERMSTTSAPALAAACASSGLEPLDPGPRALEQLVERPVPERSPGERLRVAARRHVLLAPLGDELELGSEERREPGRVVADDGQAGAACPGPSVRRSRSRPRRRARARGPTSRGSAAGRRRRPGSGAARGRARGRSGGRAARADVAVRPRDLRGACAEPAPRSLERRLRDVEHGHVGEARSSRRPASGEAPPPTSTTASPGSTPSGSISSSETAGSRWCQLSVETSSRR